MQPAFTPTAAFATRAFLRAGLLAAAGLAAGSCAVEKQVHFDAKAHAAPLAKGDARIEGEGFIRRKNAWLARCSGEIVYLVPDTAYFREWVEIYRSGHTLGNAKDLNEIHKAAVRKTQCNMKGQFAFENLPAGKWLLITRLTYDSEGSVSFTSQYDYTLVTQAETKAGETTPVILANPNRI